MNNINDVVGKIHSVETCGTVDGPGIRYVVFTQGCPLRCMYCHNPDTWDANGKGSLTKSVGELMSDILKYKSYFKFSGGGVTLTGGEPLMQREFALALLSACKGEGLHTALDTSGFGDIDDLTKKVLSRTDLVLLDIKSINADTFKKVSGFPIDKTLAFAEYLREAGITAWARFVLVPGLTDNEEDLHALASYLTTLTNVEKVGILPFHQMGAYKWQELKLNYQLKDTPTPSETETERVRDLFRSYGFIVR
ncbi:MAG: pyruvate formate-lyase-activating protein [Defluviitaleaceae bacterium]|nr:pyruvate formate-lyase-activating protein [Defluviitaleaceae bacterium]